MFSFNCAIILVQHVNALSQYLTLLQFRNTRYAQGKEVRNNALKNNNTWDSSPDTLNTSPCRVIPRINALIRIVKRQCFEVRVWNEAHTASALDARMDAARPSALRRPERTSPLGPRVSSAQYSIRTRSTISLSAGSFSRAEKRAAVRFSPMVAPF
jgi:hypothetical protein